MSVGFLQRRRPKRDARTRTALGNQAGIKSLSALRPSTGPHTEPAVNSGLGISHSVRRYGSLQLSERVLLKHGDRIRVSSGPYYEDHDEDGNLVKTKMAERGVMVFEEYCELGESRWIVARGKAGYAALHIGLEERSEVLPSLVRRPYKIRKVRSRKNVRIRAA